ncbi:hypothetical protein R1sor_026949 [Riccia sorocarpa]|uniref:Uncharacterized protein n=1 Tax=Riccia sorocarpa TaxID=122646 RepID=A0ABD3GEC3_9MARC
MVLSPNIDPSCASLKMEGMGKLRFLNESEVLMILKTIPRVKNSTSQDKRTGIDDSPVSHNTRLGVAKKHPQQQNVGNVPEELHRKGADTPQSRSSSVVKRDILRTQGDRGIVRGLFRTKDESGQAGERGELGERLRVRHLPLQEGIIDANIAEKATLGLGNTVAKISKDHDRCRIAAMSEVAETSQGVREKPEGSLSGEHGNYNWGTGGDIDSHRGKAPPKSPRPAGVLSSVALFSACFVRYSR